ncbi:MAG: hypothetical protein C4518_02425 [Desulfobacteraceae bacterium]|nr:MAG: hypothetical protein C4518_02425 [Desulfobacteraceae bacterium]
MVNAGHIRYFNGIFSNGSIRSTDLKRFPETASLSLWFVLRTGISDEGNDNRKLQRKPNK